MMSLARSPRVAPKLPPWNSVATWLPGADSAVMLSNNRSWASGGRYIRSPSALHADGLLGSKPLSRSAVGQSSRRSMATTLRSAVGSAPSADIVAVLNSVT
ncbi:hypothetical protein BH09ACT7_BH09ACT7_59180 [soil metagenome]